ncbi:MAG: cupin domain-containing protein [Acidobacteriales bacterium]|nr:cupin domain-containing protein [Terriglobales bacterium]
MPRSNTNTKRAAHGHPRALGGMLTIGEAARQVKMSASALRDWERLGLVTPQRTPSRYRLYSPADVKLLKHAVYLNRVRGLNAPAIIELLKRRGLLSSAKKSAHGSGAAAGLGPLLRQARTQRGKSLDHVARATNISVGFLSNLERSQASASVGTLRRLADYFQLNVLDFFDQSGSQPLVRPKQRKRLDAGPGVRMELLAWGNTVMEPHLFRVAPGKGSGGAYAHEGEEFLYLLNGELEIALAGETYRMMPGDSLYFESSTPHQWSNPGNKETLILWVNTPPTF